MTIYDPSKQEIMLTKFSQWLLKRYYKRFVETLELQANDKVIDFGSGTGFLANLMSKKLVGRESWISCVEISEKWNEVAQKKLKKYPNVDFYCGMITELAMKEDYYDKVVIHVVLHDVAKKHQQGVVDALARRLKKNGQLILREPINASHGIPVAEVRELMAKAGLVEIKGEETDCRFLGTVFDGVFEKK